MSGGGAVGRVLGALLRPVVDSLLKPRRRDHRRASAPTGALPRGTLPGLGTVPSPGSTGAEATRELDTAEIRRLRFEYAPRLDGDPDPGEVVWTWVPYAENDGRGKDRPVLIVARIDDGAVAGCYLSTRQHRGFVSVGRGGWDSQGRESFLNPERVLLVSERGMRREGQTLGRDAFVTACAAIAAEHGLSR